MGSKKVQVQLISPDGVVYEVAPEKAAFRLLAVVASGRVTRQTVTAAKKLMTAEKVREVMKKFPVVVVEIDTEKESKRVTFGQDYLRLLAGVPEKVFEQISTEILMSNRGRHPITSQKEEELDI